MVKTQKDFGVDMVVVIPPEILQEKDYLDLRYFYKRAYYLAVIAATIQKEFGSEAELSFEHLNDNPLCPVLSLQPAAKGDKPKGRLDYRIRIVPCAPEGFFPKTKLQLGASLIRKGRETDSEDESEPTAFYNSTLAGEGTFFAYLKLLRQTEKKCRGFKNACILGRTWLQQRGFGGDISKGGFGHFEWAVLLALILQPGESNGHKAVPMSINSTQLFMAMIQFLAINNFSEKPCVFGNAKTESDLEEYLQSGPILYDSTRQVNIAFKVGPWSATLLQQHAKWTRSLLSDSTADQFSPTFILRADLPSHTYDMFAHLNYSDILDKVLGDDISESRGRSWQLGSKVYNVLKRALADKELGERARLIHILTPARPKWALTEKPKSQEKSGLEIGILFDPLNVARAVDRGPTAGPSIEETEECEKFRNFWGDRSELRRFERDTIRETLIWKSTTPFDLCEEIMRYILGTHLRIGNIEGELDFYGNGLDALLSLKPSDTTVYNEAKAAFSSFERDIRDLENLPLRVRQMAPICPELRHASIKLPTFKFSKSGPRPLDCVISFEASGKWPESAVAIQRTKIAFLLMTGNLLEQAKPGQLRTHVGMEDAEFDTENLAFLDVIYESGAAFRLRIHSDLEESLLERQVKDKTQEQYLRQRATTHLAAFRRLYTNLPIHNQTISRACTRFPALSPTIRLVKHWFSSHKLSCHFTEEFIELVVLHIFLSPYPWDAPSSASTGFARVLLFLSRWDWRTEPLIVDTSSGEMPKSDRQAISTRLEAWRKIDPNMNHTVLLLATAQEPSGVAWTGTNKPSKMVATRMTTLARVACQLIKEEGLTLDYRRLFVPSLKEYDVLVHLNMKAIKECLRSFENEKDEDYAENAERKNTSNSRFKNLDERTGMEALPVAEHPSDVLLRELNRVYGGDGVLVFFRGLAEEDGIIGGVWNPGMGKRRWRIGLGGNYKVGEKRKGEGEEEEEGEEETVEVNRDAVLGEIARVGGGLVERVEVRS